MLLQFMFRLAFIYFAAITCLTILLLHTFQPQFCTKEKNYIEESQVINDGYKIDIILNTSTSYTFRWS